MKGRRKGIIRLVLEGMAVFSGDFCLFFGKLGRSHGWMIWGWRGEGSWGGGERNV